MPQLKNSTDICANVKEAISGVENLSPESVKLVIKIKGPMRCHECPIMWYFMNMLEEG
jgi:hypothetical protein